MPAAQPRLGVCYYPEQWPRARWPDDARRMRELGLSVVRIGEFAWTRMEPRPGEFDWAWLDDAIACLADQGLQIVLGTPTAAPPAWLVQAHPEVLPVDARGAVKAFGSRRHYDFSSPAFADASRRIVTAMAERYGRHPAVIAWQVDNEYGCHDTVLSYSSAALAGFRRWLAERYGSVQALNTAWGTDFWSLQVERFDDVGFPVGQPTLPLPAHALDFRRFASDEVLRFHRMQVEILRRHSPGRDVLHNFMGLFGEFDTHAMAPELDLATWDNYPLGFTDTAATFLDEAERLRWARTGHPDISAFHHDLYRGVAGGRWGVMEQQAGPVNWAHWNALPLPGMVRAWTWEAIAHGAELVSYFRWRQLPHAQEQMHSGLHTPDDRLDHGGQEAALVAAELKSLALAPDAGRGRVAMVFDFSAHWMVQILPHGADMSYFGLLFEQYSALRRLGLDVDIVAPDAALDGYRLVLLTALACPPQALVERLAASDAVVVLGPRTGSKTAQLAIPPTLPPGPLAGGMPVRVRAAESLRPGLCVDVLQGEQAVGQGRRWRDIVEPLSPDVEVLARYADGAPAWLRHQRWYLQSGVIDDGLQRRWLAEVAAAAGLATQALPEGLRLRQRGDVRFAIHRGPGDAEVPAPADAVFLLGDRKLPPGGVAAWKAPQ